MGTLRDWKILKRKITYMDRYMAYKWLDQLLPIINKFIAAIEHGEVDKDFWMAMYDVVAATHIGNKHRVHGWVCNFFPYISENLDE